MPLSPDVAKILQELEASDQPSPDELPPPMARRQMSMLAPPVDVERAAARLVDRTLPGPAGEIPVRIYYPDTKGGPFPAVVYFHGGGWVLGDLDTHNALCNALCHSSGCAVVAVDYRLAPEHPYPAAAEDAYAAATWVATRGEEIDVDPSRVVVAGDSAGGNLAAVASLMARDRGEPHFALQVLVYPITDCDFDTPSYRDNATGYQLTRDLMKWFWELYTPDLERATEPHASPLRAASLEGLPPAVVITAEFDPLRDEGKRYADRLEEAGCAVERIAYDGMIHGFFRMTHRLKESWDAIHAVSEAIRDAVNLPA